MNILDRIRNFFIRPCIEFTDEEINAYLDCNGPEEILGEISKIFNEIIKANNFIHNKSRWDDPNPWDEYKENIQLLEQKIIDNKHYLKRNLQLLELYINAYFEFKYRIRVTYEDDIGEILRVKGSSKILDLPKFELLKDTMNTCRYDYDIGYGLVYQPNLLDLAL